MKKSSLYMALFDLLKAVIAISKTATILLFVWLRGFFLIRLGLFSIFLKFSKTNRIMKKCRKDICKTLKSLGKLDNALIAYVREVFERTETGKTVVKMNPNRRLYAVLIPTKEENLQRIKNVFDFMSYEEKSQALIRLNYLIKNSGTEPIRQSVSF